MENSEELKECYIVGKVLAIFFQNPTNFYKVVLVNVLDTNTGYLENEIVVTGNFGDLQENDLYQFKGHIVEHPRYGLQFQSETYQQEKPTTKSGLVAYLSSDQFPGIGKKTAENILDALGSEAIDIIVEQPERLKEVKGLTPKKRQMLTEKIRLNYGMEQIVLQLNSYGFGNQLSLSIYQHYQEKTLEVLRENPYQLTEDIEGIGFKRADQLAEQLGYEATSPRRIQAGILHELFQLSILAGDTYVEADQLLVETIQTLEGSRPVEILPELVADQIIELVQQEKIQQEETKLYDNSLFYAEWGIASQIQRLLERKKEINYEEKEVEQALKAIQKREGIKYGPSQLLAIKEAIKSPLFILTGGPGTGKTTVINGLVMLFAELNGLSLDLDDYTNDLFPILLAAPTGRAAKRMNETTQLPSGTIHRLLGLTGREKNPEAVANDLDGSLLIVDEMSMVDTWLANTLLKAIPTNMQVILVGDKDQLPSVGPGQVLHDLLTIPTIPKCELVDIYRQGTDSTIISLAHSIIEGQLPVDFTQNKPDRSYFECQAYQIEPVIRQIVTRAKEKGFEAKDIQVLAPMYRGPAGIDRLNIMLQNIFNPNEDGTRKEVTWNKQVYRIGDKVLQLVNNPESNVFNGDMGEITGISLGKENESKVDELTVRFDEVEIVYPRNEWSQLTLSYCCSIHKSQGSEFKMVIVPMVMSFQRMLQRNLLYTAITRSKDILILLGEEQAFSLCVNNLGTERKTTLVQRIISSTAGELTHQLTQELQQQLKETPKLKEKKRKEPLPETKEISLFDETVDEFHVEESEALPDYLTIELIKQRVVDPMIGMEGKTPFDFMSCK
ncbi:SF1B family DNA helicase RecD2 [Vagococcus humatus]|uniref:ATP-dependent RecD2 DNA helicase n=1 Tax=Vagococcus humatus TaxID=1889241 RepID=A0A429Z9L7_9ENTE|nr:ATP-dependent RecD-like DNA helicase [Vagococcus humatus]RST90356.1 ATP-dependent RecD-like DNA helicase [Vagococcus humatus]